MVCWSKNAAESNPVRDEYEQASKLGVEIINILLDETDLPKELVNNEIIDFRNMEIPRNLNESSATEFTTVISENIIHIDPFGGDGGWISWW